MPDELAELFPELAGLFNAADSTPPPAESAPPGEHGGVTDEDLNSFFANNPGIRSLPGLPPLVAGQQPTGPMFQPGQGAPPPVGGVEDGQSFTPSPTSTSPANRATPSDQTQGIPGSVPQQGETGQAAGTLPPPPVTDPAESAQLQALGKMLRDDPELRQIFAARLQGQTLTPPAAPAAPAQPFQQPPTHSEPTLPPTQQQVSTPPPDLDLEDPQIKALYDLVQTTKSDLEQQRQVLNQTQQASVASAEAQATALYRTAAEGFAQRYDLEQTDLDHLSNVAARLGVLNTLSQGIDPLTGLPVRQDPIAAIDRALEIAYYTDPTYRQKEWERQAKVRREDMQRKQKLAAVQGNSGSAPRSTPAPTTEEGMRRQMTSEVREMMNGSWAEPVAN